MADTLISIDSTPNGYGDAVVSDGAKDYFVKPYVTKMRFDTFVSKFNESKKDGSAVYYLQHQNDNFRTEFPEKLKSDIGKHLETWASTAFGLDPDAVNFWLGDSRSVSSLHSDHYENVYAVVAGQKRFTLLPPTDLIYLYKRPYTAATFLHTDDEWKIVQDEPTEHVPWIPVDPDLPDLVKFPKAANLKPLHVTVNAGEVLYLPSLVFHKVSQGEDHEGKTIAINYWYDMNYDIKYNYYKFMESMILELKLDQ
eukprot:TRINITY_DN2424_c0_g1_i2.p1 TRINITY_DN2424_c0_g1~~TRINITY_DN2424_c0_g1_i2.p1  ORF type:complete len:253 (+),score=36.96 TRINITY_DN2424_c0_g1_i2:311-1069(+)